MPEWVIESVGMMGWWVGLGNSSTAAIVVVARGGVHWARLDPFGAGPGSGPGPGPIGPNLGPFGAGPGSGPGPGPIGADLGSIGAHLGGPTNRRRQRQPGRLAFKEKGSEQKTQK